MPKDQQELDGMPERQVPKKISLLNTNHESTRDYEGREQVKFEISGYVAEISTKFLEDEDNPEVEVTKIHVTSIKEKR